MTQHSRHAKGGKAKGTQHKKKQETRRERSSRTPAGAPAPAGPADEAEQLKAKRTKRAAKVKAWREKTGGVAARPKNGAKKPSKSQRMRANASAEIAKLPKDLGATAEGRTQAFASNKRKGDGARQAAERAVRQAVAPLEKLAEKGRHAEAAAICGGFIRHPSVRPYHTAGGTTTSDDVSLALTFAQNAGSLIQKQAGGGKKRGARTYQSEAGTQSYLTAVTSRASPRKPEKALAARRKQPAATPAPTTTAPGASSPTSPALPVRKVSRMLNLPRSTTSDLLKKARVARRALMNDDETHACWVELKRRWHRCGGRCKITPEKLQKLVDWINRNEYVRTCPERKQTLLIRGADGKRNVRVPKLLCEVGLTKLFLQAEKEILPQIGLDIREWKFRKLLPANLRKLTKRFESCGNPVRLKAARLHQALRIFRARHKNRLAGRAAAAYKPPEHKDAEAALTDGLPQECQPVFKHLRPAACWMRRGCACGGIQRRYRVPKEEKATGSSAPTITFSTYEYHIQGKTRKGRPRKVFMLVKKTWPIGRFMEEQYLPMLEEMDYHTNNHRLLRHCEKQRRGQVRPGDGDDERDFGEKMQDAFEDAPQADHFTSRNVTEEASITRTYPKQVCDDFARAKGAFADGSTAPPAESPLKDTHELFLSSYEKQDSTVVHRNMDQQIDRLQRTGRLRPGRKGRPPTFSQNVDGCAGQYWSSKAAYTTAKIAKSRRVTIDRARSAPGEGKRKVDGVHAVFKTEAHERMAMQDDGTDRKPLIEAASRVDDQPLDFAEAVHRVMSRDCTQGAAVSMNAKRQRDGAMESRTYHLYKEHDVKLRKLGKFATVKVPTTAEERRDALPYCGWRGHFNLRLDPALPLSEEPDNERGEGMLRRWGCLCDSCYEQLQHPDLEERYKPNPNCELAAVVGTLNDWKRVTFRRKSSGAGSSGGGDDGDEDDQLSDDSESDAGDSDSDASEVLEVAAGERLGAIVLPGDWITFEAGNDPKAAGSAEAGRYYSAQATSAMYVLEEDEDSDWGTLPEGSPVLDATYNNLVFAPDRSPRWYTPSHPPIKVRVPVELLLHVGFAMPIAKAPTRVTPVQRQAIQKGARVLSEHDHLQTLDALAQH